MIKKVVHWVSLSRKNNNIFIFDSFGIGDIPNKLYKIYKNYNIIQIYIEFKILIQIYVVYFVFYSVYTKLIQKINSYLFWYLFNSNNFLKNELI